LTITETQARALANLLHQLRPEWVTTSILTLLWEHRDDHPFPELCTAAVTVANDTSKRTPGIIFMDGQHWHPQRPQTAASRQFLTAAEKSRLQAAQRAGYESVINGFNPFDTSQAFYQPLISPDDLNPAATMEAFQRGQTLARWEMRQRTPQLAAIEASQPETLEETQP
jgi:hypothetical protein